MMSNCCLLRNRVACLESYSLESKYLESDFDEWKKNLIFPEESVIEIFPMTKRPVDMVEKTACAKKI